MNGKQQAITILLLIFLVPVFAYWYAVHRVGRGLIMTAATILGTAGTTYFFGLYVGLAIAYGVSIPLLYRDIVRIHARQQQQQQQRYDYDY